MVAAEQHNHVHGADGGKGKLNMVWQRVPRV